MISFFIYRDPRDVVVSLLHYMRNKPASWPTSHVYTDEQIIIDIICIGSIANGNPPGNGIMQLYSNYISWMQMPGMCVLRFEDLVGPSGGGNEEIQIQAVIKIVHHLGLQFSYDEIVYIAKNLFGNTLTFRKGTMGIWKKYFTAEYKQMFKKRAGKLLIDLGYETDLNW